jgi:archaellin
VANVNYGFVITQQNQQILENNNIYSEKGLSTLITRPLNSEEPVLIRVSINGIGIPENQDEWTGPKGEVVMFTVVPEFGAIAIIPLAITITVMLFLTTKKSNVRLIK